MCLLNDSGEYKVVVYPVGDTFGDGAVRLDVYVPVSNVQATASSTEFVEFSSSVRLSCSSPGSSLSFLWMNSSSEVTASDRVQLTDGGANLTIVDVTRYDEGPFVCRVSNPVSHGDSDPIKLSISYGPENVRISPSQEYHEEGSNISLSCSADSRPAAQFQWFLNGDLLPDTGPELILTNIQMSESGNYSCQAFNSKTLRYQTSQSAAVTVLIGLCYGAGVITVDSHRGAAGESVTFTTSVKPAAESFLALTWSVNGTINVITSTSVDVVGHDYENRITLDKSTGSLVLRNLTEKDSGEYELIIIPQGAGQIQGTANLEVMTTVSRPTMACPTENLIEGKTSVNLTCDTDGFMSTRVWMKDGKRLVSGDRFRFYDGNRVLSISPVNRRDTGEFLCNVSNDISFDTARCTLKVYCVSRGDGVLPDRLIATVGAPVMFTTTVTPPETPFLVVSWGFSGIHGLSNIITSSTVIITEPPYVDRVTLFRSTASLELRNVSLNDNGEYTVTVIPNGGVQQRGNCKLTVYVGPENINLTLSPSQEYYDEGADVSLICLTDSRPAAQFQWFLNGHLLPDNGPELRLMNIQRSQSGNYSCRAFNDRTMRNQTSQPIAVFVLISNISDVVITPSATDLSELSSSVSLSCSSSGSFPSFVWLNDTSEVTTTDRVQLTDGGAILSIINVTRYDQGPFICHVFNNFSNYTSDPVKLFISWYIKAHLFRFQMWWQRQTTQSCSSSAALSVCPAPLLDPLLSFLWMNGSSEVTASDRVQLTDEGGTLTILTVTRYDQGPFRCRVSNGVSGGISQPVNVFIQYGPDNVAIKGPESIHVGDFTVLYCSTMSVPSAKFTWLFNGKPAGFHEAVYIIPSIRQSDSGTYTCTALNTATEQSQTVNHKLTVIDFSDCDCSVAAGRDSTASMQHIEKSLFLVNFMVA
ncbi:hypothetical protein L3Q82_002424 [Scortum barcoo]|uniref:Uncharacterized protein n=1 Tax=Scortum barcoo TaxID=214431 RepID=A0ACB8W177_9TELE|nr:hypothetical protein L3Q82_002424 [Scortum barcoo]